MPTQQEMNDMMKEMQKAMDDMSPEDKKMMDSMGVKMPDMKNMQQMASFASANANAEQNVLVPKRDAARIASIQKTPLTKSALPAYLQSLYQKLTTQLPTAIVTKANELYNTVKTKYGTTDAIAAAGAGCWAFGKTSPALLLLSRACTEDPVNANHLNNFAAMLSMTSGEQLALPILNYLNKEYPKNSTILNNLAHAWFGLGDVTNASKYIDSTLKLCAWHPQANQIKAAIEESKGNHDGAVKAMKQAISHMHSSDKEQKLEELGYELKPKDIQWNQPSLKDPLSLSTFTLPDYPTSLDDCLRLDSAWENFEEQCMERNVQLAETLATLAEKVQENQLKLLSNPVQSTAYVSRLGLLPPLAAEKAALVLGDPLNGASAQRVEEIKKQIESFDTTADSLEAKYNSRYQEIEAKYSPKFGEGKANPFEAACQDHSSAQNEYLSAVNGLLSKLHLSYLKAYRQYSYDLLYYALNTQPQLQYEITRTNVQLQWIGALQMLKPVFMKYKEMYCLNVPKPAETRHTLANFDDINCQYKSTMNLLFGTIKTECGRTTAEMEIDFVKIGWETQSADREENRNFFDEFQRCTIEVSAGKSKSFGEGPLQLQTSVGATGFLEFDRTGLKDAGVKLNADVSVGTNVLDTKVETGIGEVNVGPKEPSVSVGGVNAIISINSGFTAGGSGILKGVKL